MKHRTKVVAVTVLAWLTFIVVFVPIVRVWVFPVVPHGAMCPVCYPTEKYESVTYYCFAVGAISIDGFYALVGGPFSTVQLGSHFIPYPGPVGIGFPWRIFGVSPNYFLSDPLGYSSFFVMVILFILGAAFLGRLLPYEFPETRAQETPVQHQTRAKTMEESA